MSRPFHKQPLPNKYNDSLRCNIIAAYQAFLDYGEPYFTNPYFDWHFAYGSDVSAYYCVYVVNMGILQINREAVLIRSGDNPENIYEMIKNRLLKSKEVHEKYDKYCKDAEKIIGITKERR